MPKRSEVERWLAAYDNPMKAVVLAIREVVLATDPRVDECIKWQAPTFTFEGNLASFYPKSKQHASLMFHQGAKIPGTHARLEGSGGTSRVMKLASLAEVTRARREIEAVVRAWIEWRAPAAEAPTAKKAATKTASAAAKKTPAKKKAKKAVKAAAKKAPAKKKAKTNSPARGSARRVRRRSVAPRTASAA